MEVCPLNGNNAVDMIVTYEFRTDKTHKTQDWFVCQHERKYPQITSAWPNPCRERLDRAEPQPLVQMHSGAILGSYRQREFVVI